MVECEAFIEGFGLGARIMIEMMEDYSDRP